jgi:hypothetical protein
MASRRTVVEQRFRLRQDLLAKLRRAAEANDRSLNEEAELRLMDSFTKGGVEKAAIAAIESLREALEQKFRAMKEDSDKRLEELLDKQAEERLRQITGGSDERTR